MQTNSYAAQSATTPLAPFSFQRRDPGAHDVQIQILYCGVCHSDVHTIRNEWHGTTYGRSHAASAGQMLTNRRLRPLAMREEISTLPSTRHTSA